MTRKNTLTAVVAAALATTGFVAVPALADNHMEAKAEAEANIVATAESTGMHNTLVSAVKAAGLAETLTAPGPFTVFAPTDAAFLELPEGTLQSLAQPENKEKLTSVLTYHAVTGKVTADSLTKMIEDNGGKATLTTVQGGTLTAMVEDGNVVIMDAKGGKATVTKADVMTSNGVIHVTDGVFMPA
ncbi:fasciclin domain-containing protein [Porphyrobacter sp. YT40]|uniref:fasciclin domain-containing protein n=1 Tax=Porphyrobacter sp. YT40 TaxID=2547601 RepID=UPI0011432785|nr:fasciclin domain-containing protein [Porphyrobacter sp. YT40]QDH34079.1 fasciclin domain-containing protein [Porphyrobacter sp. YT40]